MLSAYLSGSALRRAAVFTVLGWAALVASGAHAATITGRVVKVADGDTLVVLDDDHVQHRVRLAAIDAPEHGQPFGRLARQSLVDLVAGKSVRVEVGALDRYGRDLGIVWLGAVNINLAQIERGMAWWYRSYADEQGLRERIDYERAEREARAARRGLWAGREPVPPWTWRRRTDAPS